MRKLPPSEVAAVGGLSGDAGAREALRAFEPRSRTRVHCARKGSYPTNLKSISYTANLPGDGLGLGAEPRASTHSSPRARGGLGVEPGASRVLSTHRAGFPPACSILRRREPPRSLSSKGPWALTRSDATAPPRLCLCMRRLAVGFGGGVAHRRTMVCVSRVHPQGRPAFRASPRASI